jgi:hypothetical protein
MIVPDPNPPFRSHVERIVERALDRPDEIVLQDISRRVCAAQLLVHMGSAARALVDARGIALRVRGHRSSHAWLRCHTSRVAGVR